MRMTVQSVGLVILLSLRWPLLAQYAPFDSKLDPIKEAIEKSDFAAAEARARELLAIWRDEGAPSPHDLAELHRMLARVMWEAGKGVEPEALEFALKGVQIGEEHLDPDDELLGSLLLELSNVHSVRTELDLQEEVLLQACDVYIRSGSEYLGICYNNLGIFYSNMGDMKKAVDYLERAVEVFASLHGRNSVDVAGGLLNLANALGVMGESSAARTAYAESLGTYEELLGDTHPKLINALNSYGYQDWEDGLYQEAEFKFRRALGICEEAERSCGSVNGNLAILYATVGHPDADHFFDRAEEIFAAQMGTYSIEYAIAIANRGRPEWDPVGKLEVYQHAHRVFSEKLGPRHLRTAWSLALMVDPLIDQNELGKAEACAAEALGIVAESQGQGPPDLQAEILRDLARIARLKGDAAQAEVFLDRALIAAIEGPGKDSVLEANLLEQRAEFFTEERRYGHAEQDLAKSEEILSGMAADQQWRLGKVFRQQASVHEVRGQWGRARERLERALEVAALKGARDRPEEAEIRLQLAGVLAGEGKREEAVREALAAERIAREHLRLTVGGLDEAAALAMAAGRVRGLEAALGWLDEESSGELVAEIFDQVVRSRALVYDEMLIRARVVHRAGDEELRSLARELERVRGQLSNLLVRELGDLPKGAPALIGRLHREKQSLEQEIGRRSAVFTQLRREHDLGLEQVRAALPPETALLSFVRYTPSQGSAAAYGGFFLSGSGIRYRKLGSAESIEDAVRRWRESVSSRSREIRKVGRSLAERVLDPWLEDLAAGTVWIVPDGSLSLVNFSALVRPSGRLWLESDLLIQYLNTERELASMPGSRKGGKGLLVVGAPDFDLGVSSAGREEEIPQARSGCESIRGHRFTKLAGAWLESEEIARVWPSEELGETVLLQGGEATEAALRADAPGVKVLHLATHGFFLNGQCPSFSMGARGIGGLVSVDSGVRSQISDPLALTGLALAGANGRGWVSDGRDDGVLTAEEVAGLELEGTEWAVLSACSTGVGELREGEGVLGLRRAFAMAGAETTIMSLWEVDDEHTREWMRQLYRKRYREGLSTAEAVRQASREMAAAGHHPVDWAAFIAVGHSR